MSSVQASAPDSMEAAGSVAAARAPTSDPVEPAGGGTTVRVPSSDSVVPAGGVATAGNVLLAPTPAGWVDHAVANWQELLVDHANCEKKAASTALALLFAYPEDRVLTSAISRLAREELRHFEQVQRMMETLAVPFIRMKPGRYAAALRAVMRSSEPGRKLDVLLVGALIEARSCERFRLLAPRLAAPLADFYSTLAQSEARHFELYLSLARGAHGGADTEVMTRRLRELGECEAELATSPDGEFRFHSGVPPQPPGE